MGLGGGGEGGGRPRVSREKRLFMAKTGVGGVGHKSGRGWASRKV